MLGVLLAVLALFILEENARGKLALHAYLHVLRAHGERLTPVELDLPQPSEEATLAAKELIIAGEELRATRKDCPFIVAGLTGFKLANFKPRRLGVFVVRHQQPDLGVPRRDQPSAIRRQRFGRGSLSIGNENGDEPASGGREPVKSPSATWDDLDAQLGHISNALARAKHALGDHYLAMPVDLYHLENTNNWPYLEAMNIAVDWLEAAALADVHRGDLDGAIEKIAIITTPGRFQQAEPQLNAQVPRRHAARAGVHMTWEMLQSVGVTDDQLARLQSLWEQYDFTNGIIDSVQYERVWHLSWFEKVRRSPEAFWEACKGEMSCCHECGNGDCSLTDYWFDAQAISRVVLWRLAWLDQDELKLLKDWQVCLDQAREAIARGDRTRFRSTAIARPVRVGWYDLSRFWLSRQLAPMDDMVVLEPMRVETERRMTVAAVALKRFELAHGAWPESLAELTPVFLDDVPRDLMDGQPLHYHRSEGNTCTLYSVGQNCEDDGGSVERDRDHLPNGFLWMTCDAVWPMPASSAEVGAVQNNR
jgi:hypothetical protein